MNGVVAYCRVSTKRQGESGLGLEAQQAAVEAYAKEAKTKVVALYVETESGRNCNRPELAKALAHAKRSKATLCVAKLDRLSRDVEFLARVMNSGCEFAAADMPAANRFVLHIMAAVAEHEAKAISERTKAALKAAKARGQLLGSNRPGHWEGREHLRQAGMRAAQQASLKSRMAAAKAAYVDLQPLIAKLRDEGRSLSEIANHLTQEGHTTRQGRPWNRMQVSRVLAMTANATKE